MSHIRTSNSTDHPSTASSRDESDSLTDEDSQYDSSQDNDGSTWAEDYGEVEPSDSASASADYYPERPRKRPVRTASRRHSRSQRQHGIPYRTVPAPQPTMSTDPSEEYPPYGGRGGYMPQGNGFYGPPQSHAGYGPQYGGRGQMVHFNNYQNPFTPMPSGGGANYFADPRQNYDMVPYQNNFFGGAPGYGMGHVPPYVYAAPPPPPTEAPGPSHTPGPLAEKKVDPEVERMKHELQLLQAEKRRQEDEIKHQQMQEQMQRTAEIEFERRMERARKEADLQAKELEKAKKDAERAALERIENQRKAEEEKTHQQKLALQRLEAEAKLKFEKERLAEEEKRKREAEISAAAEAALKAKMEAAEAAARAKAAAEFKAEIEAKEAEERKKKEEIEWRKQLEAEAKLKAEVEARAKLEEERKKAEEAKKLEEERKAAEKALRERIVEETKAKMQEEAKKGEKAPIRFKDAVGRKFSFPFHLCKTWPGMEELIKQAFVQVEALGPHVQEGHYDLIGPNGEIILPSIWEKVVQPDWAITMHMWPMDKAPPLRNGMHGIPPGAIPIGGRHMHGPPGRGMPMPFRPGMMPPGAVPPHPWAHMRPGMARGGPMPRGMGAAAAQVVNGDLPRHDKKKGGSTKSTGASFLQFMGGKPAKASKKRK